MQLRSILFLFLIICGASLLFSCEDYKDCNAPVDTSLGLGFYQIVNQREKDSTLPSATLYGIGKEDSLVANKTAIRQIRLPLNQTRDITQFFIRPDSTLQKGDTITIQYVRNLHFVSSGCGFTTFYKLDTAYSTRYYIDSIALVNKKITTTNATNLKIYY